MSLVGLDIGTTGCKAALFDEQGRLLHLEYREYPLEIPQAGWMELDPEIVWQDVLECLRGLADRARSDPPRALSISSQGEAVMAVGEKGETLSKAVLTFDSRAVNQADTLRGAIDDLSFFQITGVNLHPMITLAKLAWWKENRPQLFDQARYFLGFPDFILRRLGLEPAMDRSMAARTGGFDIRYNRWSDEVFEALQLDVSRMASVHPAGTPLGELGNRGSRLTGLPEKMLVAVGGHDQCCAALGAGVTGRGEALYTLGTAEVILTALEEFQTGLGEHGFPCYPHVLEGRFVSAGFNFTGGVLLRWYRDQFFGNLEGNGDRVYQQILDEMPARPSGLLVLPYFTMSGTPYFDTRARGALIGLSLETTRGQITRGLIEGLSYETLLNLDLMRRAQVRPESLSCVGGGAKSTAALQVRANVLGLPIKLLETTEGASLGAALIGGKAAGIFSDLATAAEQLAAVNEILEPDAAEHEYYQTEFERYRLLYPAVRQI